MDRQLLHVSADVCSPHWLEDAEAFRQPFLEHAPELSAVSVAMQAKRGLAWLVWRVRLGAQAADDRAGARYRPTLLSPAVRQEILDRIARSPIEFVRLIQADWAWRNRDANVVFLATASFSRAATFAESIGCCSMTCRSGYYFVAGDAAARILDRYDYVGGLPGLDRFRFLGE